MTKQFLIFLKTFSVKQKKEIKTKKSEFFPIIQYFFLNTWQINMDTYCMDAYY